MSEQVLSFPAVETPRRQQHSVWNPSQGSHNQRAVKPLRRITTEYRLLFAVTFSVFLVGALIEAVIPQALRRHSASDAKKMSIIQRASAGTKTCLAYAFMG